jgi:hypothetical protein
MRLPKLTVKPGAVALMALMTATRFHHFGTPFALPDASLAIFFLASLWLGGRYLFAVLLLEAGLIDYLAITKLGVSDFCVSNAYAFLIPTYAVMWLGGKYCRQFESLTLNTLAKRLAALVIATSSAFLMSNGSFYWLSGRYPEANWTQYIERVAKYYPPYMTTTLLYVVVIFAAISTLKALSAHKASQQTV